MSSNISTTSEKKSSFKPKGNRAQTICLPGTCASLHSSQLLVSSGIPSLDGILGGGIPVGSLLLLEEDESNVYAQYFMKCFLAEGVTSGHEVMVASVDSDPVKLISSLPSPVPNKEDSREENDESESMKIAWRYQNLNQVTSCNNSRSFGHHYDLKSTMSADLLDNCEKFYWDGKEKHPNSNATALPLYRNLFSCLHSLLSARKLFTSTPNDKPNIMRIGIFSLASCEWGDDLCHSLGSDSTNPVWSEVTSFFALLRALARQSYTVAFVSVPSYLFVDSALLGRLSYHADYVIGLESFQGTDKEVNPLFKEYHGLLHINKISAGNSLVAPFVDTHDWVFRLKRKKLSIEKLHLPPDLSETVSRSATDPVKNTVSCSGSLPNKLDF